MRELVNKIRAMLLMALLPFGILLIVLPIILFFITDCFEYSPLFLFFFTMVTLEKFWAMFFPMRNRFSSEESTDWTAVTVGLSGTAVMYATLLEYVFRHPSLIQLTALGIGTVLLVSGVILRYDAFHHLGRQWTINVDKYDASWQLVTSGPYGYIRHPMYVAACLELTGLPLIFGAYFAFWLALLVFVPCEIQRAYFEEQYLMKSLGRNYLEYRRKTWAFFPLPIKKDSPS